MLIVCALANAEVSKPPAFSEMFSVDLPEDWELAEEGWKSGETGGEMLFSIEPGPEPYVTVMGHVVRGGGHRAHLR